LGPAGVSPLDAAARGGRLCLRCSKRRQRKKHRAKRAPRALSSSLSDSWSRLGRRPGAPRSVQVGSTRRRLFERFAPADEADHRETAPRCETAPEEARRPSTSLVLEFVDAEKFRFSFLCDTNSRGVYRYRYM